MNIVSKHVHIIWIKNTNKQKKHIFSENANTFKFLLENFGYDRISPNNSVDKAYETFYLF